MRIEKELSILADRLENVNGINYRLLENLYYKLLQIILLYNLYRDFD